MIINFVIECPNCGAKITHKHLTLPQDEVKEIEIDLDGIMNTADFECSECGCEIAIEKEVVYQ